LDRLHEPRSTGQLALLLLLCLEMGGVLGVLDAGGVARKALVGGSRV
jgi:hypothetical protein